MYCADNFILSALIASPLLGVVCLLLLPATARSSLRAIATISALFPLILSLFVAALFNFQANPQLIEKRAWLDALGISYIVGVDGLSVLLVVLTAFLSTLVIFSSSSVKHNLKSYLILLLLLEVGMLGALLALELVTFYVFWELMLIPMYLLILMWGGQRRSYAAIKFVLFTASGSLIMLVGIIYLGFLHQTQYGVWSFELDDLLRLKMSYKEQMWLFVAFVAAFAIKVPVFPLHTWLPDAHVEAPTGGSVILAGVLLKMGLYGFFRFCLPLFPIAVAATAPLWIVLAVIGIIYGALMAWVQDDIKKLVAYSSVSHLGFCLLGFASLNLQGFQGSILQMLNHGISTGALFLLVGVLYDRRHTRLISDYSGLASRVPVFAFVFLVITFSSVALPITNGFVGEFLILLGGFKASPVATAIASCGVILGAVYMLSLYRRICFGELNEANKELKDLTASEAMVLFPLVVFVFWIGIWPNFFLRYSEATASGLLKEYNQAVTDSRLQVHPTGRSSDVDASTISAAISSNPNSAGKSTSILAGTSTTKFAHQMPEDLRDGFGLAILQTGEVSRGVYSHYTSLQDANVIGLAYLDSRIRNRKGGGIW